MIPADIDVWLDTGRIAQEVGVIPVVRTAREMGVDYRIQTVGGRKGGSTRIAQSGAVTSTPAKPAAIEADAHGHAPTERQAPYQHRSAVEGGKPGMLQLRLSYVTEARPQQAPPQTHSP